MSDIPKPKFKCGDIVMYDDNYAYKIVMGFYCAGYEQWWYVVNRGGALDFVKEDGIRRQACNEDFPEVPTC